MSERERDIAGRMARPHKGGESILRLAIDASAISLLWRQFAPVCLIRDGMLKDLVWKDVAEEDNNDIHSSRGI